MEETKISSGQTLPSTSPIADTKLERLVAQAAHGKPLCIIPARKRSTRLPGKNKKLLNGKPLFMYAVDAAKKSEIFDDIIVSSDDMDILEIAYEAKVRLHLRAQGLAHKKAQVKDVLYYLCTVLGFETFCLMQPNNPFVTAKDLQEAYELMLKKEANYVMSMVRGKPVEYADRIQDGFIVPRKGAAQSQKYEPVYYHDGSFIFGKAEVFMPEFEYDFRGSRCLPYLITHPSIDIDTEEDFRLAECLLKEGHAT